MLASPPSLNDRLRSALSAFSDITSTITSFGGTLVNEDSTEPTIDENVVQALDLMKLVRSISL